MLPRDDLAQREASLPPHGAAAPAARSASGFRQLDRGRLPTGAFDGLYGSSGTENDAPRLGARQFWILDEEHEPGEVSDPQLRLRGLQHAEHSYHRQLAEQHLVPGECHRGDHLVRVVWAVALFSRDGQRKVAHPRPPGVTGRLGARTPRANWHHAGRATGQGAASWHHACAGIRVSHHAGNASGQGAASSHHSSAGIQVSHHAGRATGQGAASKASMLTRSM